ncbi:MAG: hypothetical protein JXA94_00645 [Parachlamydiales bacterium]|nr:hypothetical protein [Parachlamydiales bacterium]
MRKIKILFFLILPYLLFAQGSDGYDVSSKRVIFEKNKLFFEESFFLEHSFGKIYANEATFNNLKKTNALFFNLKDDVKLIFNDAGTLLSDFANFNLATSKIKFYSKDFVIYKDKINNKDFSIKSKKVQCILDTKNYLKKPKLENIYSVNFLQNVEVFLDEKAKIYCDKASFEKDEIYSFIYLYPEKDSKIKFLYDKDEIESSFAKLDIKEQSLFLKNPKGALTTIMKKDTKLNFSSKSLVWQNFENCLTLKNDVMIQDKNMTIHSDEVELLKKANENAIHKVISKRNTEILFNSNEGSKISTNGIIELDTEKNKINAFSSKKEKEDLLYEDDMVSISAKKATLSYNSDQTIDNIYLEKQIKLIYKKEKEKLGYAIADKMLYSPIDGMIKLIGDKDNKVLFWQENGAIKLSSEEIHISQKEKDYINGVGDVRFTFNMDEENLIHEIFSKYLGETVEN